MNGILLLSTAAFGIAGVILSLTTVPAVKPPKLESFWILTVGIIAYVILLLITRYAFHRVVTTELILIVGWVMLEAAVIRNLNAAGGLTDPVFALMYAVIAIAFTISIILYVAYYRMEEMKAYYAAMVPLVAAAVSMVILVAMADL